MPLPQSISSAEAAVDRSHWVAADPAGGVG